MDVPEFTLKEVHFVLEGFRAAFGREKQISCHGFPQRAAKAKDERHEAETNRCSCAGSG